MTNAIQPSRVGLDNISETALQRLKSQLVSSMTGAGGAVLSPLQASQIALITLTTDLSPFLGEVYPTDKGIMIGVVAYERKAQEYLDAFHPGVKYHVAYRPATPGQDGDFQPERGDVAYVARLTRDDWDREWQNKLSEQLSLLRAAGITGREAYDLALNEIGPKPFVEAVGIVDGREKFSGMYKQGEYAGEAMPEAFDRHERAKKRARKNVIKHTFPRLSIPDPMKILADDQAVRLVERATNAIEPPAPKPQIPAGMTDKEYENTLMHQLGYASPPSNPAIIQGSARPAPEPNGETLSEETERPYSAAYARRKLQDFARSYEARGEGLSEDRFRSVVRTNLEACFADRDAEKKRKTVLDYVFNVTSTKDLTPAQVKALHKWLDAKPDSGGAWMPNPDSTTEARALYEAALIAQGQTQMFA